MSIDDEIGAVLADINALSNKQQSKTLLKQANILLTLFKQEYYKTYRNVPMIGNIHATRNTLKNLIKACENLDKAKIVVSNMFTDRWEVAKTRLNIKQSPSLQLFAFTYGSDLIEILSNVKASKPNHKTQFNPHEEDI